MAQIDVRQLIKVREFLRGLPEKGVEGIPFSSEGPYAEIFPDLHPPRNHPQAIKFFFYLTSQNYGFWYGDERGYVEPLYGVINGKRMKGAEAFTGALKRALDKDETIFEPSRLAAISPHDLAHVVFADDNGPIPFPDFEARFQLTRAYGQWFEERKTTPEKIVADANKQKESLAAFLAAIEHIPGYDEDTFKKKNMLLAMALESRPEKFLKVSDPEHWRAVIDYHLKRLALRLGIVELDAGEAADNAARRWVLPHVEENIRAHAYMAINHFIKFSGKSAAYVDQIFWWGRKFCPEMEPPDCAACIFTSVCAKRTEFFQPIFRTTAY